MKISCDNHIYQHRTRCYIDPKWDLFRWNNDSDSEIPNHSVSKRSFVNREYLSYLGNRFFVNCL